MEKLEYKDSNKKPSINDNAITKLSVCGVIKDHTLDVLQKLESEMPSVFQSYSDLYVRYLHSVRDIFGTCSLAEKQYFDKTKIDQNTLKIFDSYLESVTNILESQIDFSNSLTRTYMQLRLSSIDSWDKYMHFCVDMYAKSMASFSSKE